MGKDLNYGIITFFKERMDKHQAVISIEDISTNDFYIYKVNRKGTLSTVIIVLSDCYYYGEFEDLSLPNEIENGGIVLIAKPEARFYADQENNIAKKILVGQIGAVLGALNREEFWEYTKPKINK